jgi:hypothetical protein
MKMIMMTNWIATRNKNGKLFVISPYMSLSERIEHNLPASANPRYEKAIHMRLKHWCAINANTKEVALLAFVLSKYPPNWNELLPGEPDETISKINIDITPEIRQEYEQSRREIRK